MRLLGPAGDVPGQFRRRFIGRIVDVAPLVVWILEANLAQLWFPCLSWQLACDSSPSLHNARMPLQGLDLSDLYLTFPPGSSGLWLDDGKPLSGHLCMYSDAH